MGYTAKLWDDYKEYLINQKQSYHTIRNKVQYGKRFYHVLEKNGARIC